MGYKLTNRPLPSNQKVKKIISQLKQLRNRLADIRSKCKHDYQPTAYTETDTGGYTVGIFDTTLVCRKCTNVATLENSPPICSCCGLSLELKVWEGKLKNNATRQHLAIWKREKIRRRKMWEKDVLAHGMFFNQFGLYVCTSELCKNYNKAKFLITGGD